jgi:C1A family cysteine protease
MSGFMPAGLGWQRDLPDPRDLSPSEPCVRDLLRGLRRPRPARGGAPAALDLREYFPPAGDQQTLQSCCAHACAGLAGYFVRRSFGRALHGSALFLYQTARRLAGAPDDRGVGLRATLKALLRFGLPPEQFCPYDVARFAEEPAAFLYSFGNEVRPALYVRLDARQAPGREALRSVKSFLAAGFPSAFGFTVFSSASAGADLPAPTAFDSVRGGQAVVAVGYDDGYRIRSTRGALLVRNSWGRAWGDGGYGWLPYAYFEEGLAADAWTLLGPDWLASGEFERPA